MPQPHLHTCLIAVEEAHIEAVAARDHGEVGPVDQVRLESIIHWLRDHRARLASMLEEQ